VAATVAEELAARAHEHASAPQVASRAHRFRLPHLHHSETAPITYGPAGVIT
jgi:hypothetical protein